MNMSDMMGEKLGKISKSNVVDEEPKDMELPADDVESFRPRVEAMDPTNLTNLVLDLAKNITTDEFEAALAEYESSEIE